MKASHGHENVEEAVDHPVGQMLSYHVNKNNSI